VVEACDNQRLYRVKKKTGLPELLIPAVSLDTIGTVDFDQVSAGDWLHLLTKSGHRVSVRCVTAAYPDLKPILRMRDAQQIELPKDLGEILGRAQVMQELAFDPLVEVVIEDNRLKLVARKEGGWFRETQSVTYSGPALRFHINPKFLLEVLTHSHVVSVGEGRMRMKGGNVTFIVCLASPGVND
jgi:DNA polymerase III sliding clamp (beta) subunit (PCNA family)